MHYRGHAGGNDGGYGGRPVPVGFNGRRGMTFGHGGNIRVSLKSPEANQLAAAKLRALINDVVSNPELGRMAC